MIRKPVASHSDWLTAARAQWHWRGQARPPFAVVPGPGQVSVWDFPRPPRLVPDSWEVVVCWGGDEIARTTRAVLALETAHPPTFYLPWDDVARHCQALREAPGNQLEMTLDRLLECPRRSCPH